MTRVKICGLTREEDISYVNKLLPEYVGFVFFEKSKRNLTFDRAHKLSCMLSEKITPVGVFVDAKHRDVVKLFNNGTIKVAQLHGHEDEDYIKELRKVAPELIIVKAFMVKSKEDMDLARTSSADIVLLDNGYGTGECFDWQLIGDIGRPFFLAGGLNVENVGDAIGKFNPYAVDISSAVETDGVKDYEKIKRFICAVRQ